MLLRASLLSFGVCGFVLAFSGSVVSQEAGPNAPPVLLQMIRDSSVQDELNLSDSQRGQVEATLRNVDGRWFRARNLPAEKQRTEISTLTASLSRSLKSVLDATQQQRLTQLERQALGTRMLTRRDVAQSLRLSPDKQQAINEAFVDTDQKSAEIQRQMRKGEISSDDAQKKLTDLKRDEHASLMKHLTDEQRSQIGGLTGKPFNFSQVKRSLPLAPEINPQGASWIQGGPLKLEDLKGKVVAVHYYAFQCINCQRNLPHYNGWHQDYADKGLVVIGIQTPETSAERKQDLVATAVKSDGIAYPVIFDGESANWKTWSNTMWPTVYLIDKKGYLRRWWQGELNWQGTPGEKQMRETIEQLLAEDA